MQRDLAVDLERETRARRDAEEQLEGLKEQLRQWRDWADEQSIREVLAEMSRFEELKRIKEDMTRQIEEACADVGQKNAELRRRAAELEREQEARLSELGQVQREAQARDDFLRWAHGELG